MSIDLTQAICELVRLTSTDLPAVVEQRLRKSQADETAGSAARGAMDTNPGKCGDDAQEFAPRYARIPAPPYSLSNIRLRSTPVS